MAAKNNKCCCGGGSSSPSESGSSSPSASPSFSPSSSGSAPVSTAPCLVRCLGNVMAAQYEVTLNGITPGVCIRYCMQVNGTWILDAAEGCKAAGYKDTGAFCPNPASNQFALLLLRFNATSITLNLSTGPTGDIAFWKKDVAQPHDCLSSHTLSLDPRYAVDGPFSLCRTIPTSVTVSPV